MSRIASFVSAARSLLVAQVLAGLLAAGVAGWAFFEVRGLVSEREQLRARVAELEAGQNIQAPQPVEPAPYTPDPLINQILPPDDLLPPETNQAAPETMPEVGNTQTPATPPVTPPGNSTQQPPGRWTPPAPPTRPQLDCAGADRGRPGCRPLPERPPIQEVPDRLTPRGEPLTRQQPPTLARPPQRQQPQGTAAPQATASRYPTNP